MSSYKEVLLENKLQIWEDIGCIETPISLQPTVIPINENTFRVYAGHVVNADLLICNVGYFDLCEGFKYVDPQFYVLQTGVMGAFDSYGVVPSAIFKVRNIWYMFYAGYQQLRDVRFCVFGGLAASENLHIWYRVRSTPVFDRVDGDLLFRVPHVVVPTMTGYHIWYCGGSYFRQGSEKTLPVYTIKYIFVDTLSYPVMDKGYSIIDLQSNEYRCGRPTLIKVDDHLFMWYGLSTPESTTIGFARGESVARFTRMDHRVVFVNQHKTYAYPNVFEYKGELYMLYNDSYGAELAKNPKIWIAKLKTA